MSSNAGDIDVPRRVVESKSDSSPDLDAFAWVGPLGRRRKQAYLTAVQVAGEAIIVAASIPLAYLMANSWPASMAPVRWTLATLPWHFLAILRAPEFTPYVPVVVVAPVVFLLVFQWMRLYRPQHGDTRPFEGAWTIFKGVALSSGILLLLAYTYRGGGAPASAFAENLFFFFAAMLIYFGVLLYHSATLIALLCLHAVGVGRTRVAVVQGDDRNDALLRAIDSPSNEYDLAGIITVEEVSQPDQRALGVLQDLPGLINKHNLNEVILAVDPAMLSTEQRLMAAQTCWKMGVRLKMVTPFQAFFHTSARSENLGGVDLLHIENLGLYTTTSQFLKRAMDIAVSLSALLVLSPVLLLTAVLIKLDSRGPVFFVQERVGLNGRTFRILKFRSMKTGGDASAHQEYLKQLIKGGSAHAVDENGNPVYKIVDDPRITKLGKFIRKTSIDELPQLINVLRGEMSLVGPRPPIPYEVDEYQEWHLKRLHIRPGITGLWQVSGRSRLSFDQMVQLDIAYIEQWSLWFDIKILFRTVPVVLHLDQAY